jgi:ankyrin repeat protein
MLYVEVMFLFAGDTVVHVAIKQKQIDTVERLVNEERVFLLLKNKEGKTPLMLAKDLNLDKSLRQLIKKNRKLTNVCID